MVSAVWPFVTLGDWEEPPVGGASGGGHQGEAETLLLKLGTMQNSTVVKPWSVEPDCLGSDLSSAAFLGLQL